MVWMQKIWHDIFGDIELSLTLKQDQSALVVCAATRKTELQKVI